ncbi:MAG: luciferase domain-containing protein [Gaiellaceae bacterium]
MDAAQAIAEAVSAWDGVTAAPHRFGGLELRYGRRELGHTHAGSVDLAFPRPVRNMLVETGRAEPHHVLPDSGWVTFRVRSEADVAEAVELFRLAYERARVAEQVRRTGRSSASDPR